MMHDGASHANQIDSPHQEIKNNMYLEHTMERKSNKHGVNIQILQDDDAELENVVEEMDDDNDDDIIDLTRPTTVTHQTAKDYFNNTQVRKIYANCIRYRGN